MAAYGALLCIVELHCDVLVSPVIVVQGPESTKCSGIHAGFDAPVVLQRQVTRRWGSFGSPVHRHSAMEGHVHRDMARTIRCTRAASWIDISLRVTLFGVQAVSHIDGRTRR